MLNAGFQYLEQRDANNAITKDGVVGKNSPFATSDNSGIYDIIAEDLRWLKENVDDVKDLSELEAIKQSVTDMYNEMKNDSSFGEATAKAQAEEAKKQAQAALESATNAKTYHDEVVSKSTEANETLAEIKSYIDKAEKLVDSNKALEQSFSDYLTMASNKAKIASDSATNAKTSETNAAESAERAETAIQNLGTHEANAAESAAKAEAAVEKLGTHEANAAASEAAAKTSETNAKTSEINAKASETSAKQYSVNSSNSADLSKAWADSSESPDSVADADSTTGKTQSAKSWAMYAKDRAISAYNSEVNATTNAENAATSASNAKTSETNAKTSETNAKQYESDAKDHMDATATSETNAKASETASKLSETNAKTSETNAKASEINSRTNATNATNSAELAKAWSESIESPDSLDDTDSTTGKTQSAKSWAMYAKDRATNAYNYEKGTAANAEKAANSATNAKTSETNAKASETNAKQYESNAKDHMDATATSETRAKASETNASTSAEHAATSEAAAKTSETNANTSAVNASNSSDLAKAWAESSESPDSVNDTDSTTGKTQSSKTWALYAKARAISAYSSESNAKASESSAKTSETNAKTSETNAKASETAAKTSETNAKASETSATASATAAKASETNASASKDSAATSETNAKSYMDTTKGYMDKTQEAYESAQAIQSIVDTAKANAEKCVADVEAVKESLSKIMVYQGSVDNYSDLPTNPQIGYSYNIKNADKTHGVNAGDNVVWNGTEWDNLGGSVDMSLFAEVGKDVSFNTVTATTFTGDLNGTATKATQDASGNVIADTYLKKSGDTMTGDLTLEDGMAILSESARSGIQIGRENLGVVIHDSERITFSGNGASSYIDTTTGEFNGDVVGNADTATKATQDADGNAIADTYLKKSGGTMSGAIDFSDSTKAYVGLKASDGYYAGIGFNKTSTTVLTGEEGIYFVPISGGASTYIDAGGYHGDVYGTAAMAAQDASGNVITTTYATKTELTGKQNKLTFDTKPTANSTNPVTSDGVKKYVDSAIASLESVLSALTNADDKSY